MVGIKTLFAAISLIVGYADAAPGIELALSPSKCDMTTTPCVALIAAMTKPGVAAADLPTLRTAVSTCALTTKGCTLLMQGTATVDLSSTDACSTTVGFKLGEEFSGYAIGQQFVADKDYTCTVTNVRYTDDTKVDICGSATAGKAAEASYASKVFSVAETGLLVNFPECPKQAGNLKVPFQIMASSSGAASTLALGGLATVLVALF